MPLSKRDKQVVSDFTDKKENNAGSWLFTDGRVLRSTGMGATTIAAWIRNKVDIAQPQTRAQQSVVNYLRKVVPRNQLQEAQATLPALLEGLRAEELGEARKPASKAADDYDVAGALLKGLKRFGRFDTESVGGIITLSKTMRGGRSYDVKEIAMALLKKMGFTIQKHTPGGWSYNDSWTFEKKHRGGGFTIVIMMINTVSEQVGFSIEEFE